MNVLVVGGAGFVGSHLVDRLLADGHAVDVVDDYSNGSLANLGEARAVGGALKIEHLDAGAPHVSSLLQLRNTEVIYHLAAIPRRVNTDAEYAEAFRSTVALFDSARAYRRAKLVVPLPATSLFGRPDNRSLPVKEQPPEPLGVRGVIGRATIDLLTMLREQAAVEFTVLTMTNVYGARQRPSDGVVASMVEAASNRAAPVIVGDGRQTRDLLYIDDAVDALARAATRGGGLMVNVGTGEQTSMNDLWAMIGGSNRLTPTSKPAQPDHLNRFAVSPVRARLQLGWSPWTTLADGIAQTRQ